MPSIARTSTLGSNLLPNHLSRIMRKETGFENALTTHAVTGKIDVVIS